MNQTQKDEARTRIEKIFQMLENGADFADLARTYSEGPSRYKAGDIGFFSRGQKNRTFEDAAFSLNSGEISGIIETRAGYHILMVIEKKPDSIMSYDQVKNSLREFLIEEKRQAFIHELVNRLSQEARIKFY